jgi:hypothetical protein
MQRIHKFGHATTADSMGDTFRHGGLQQQGQYHHYQQQTQSPSIPLPSLSPPATQDVSTQPMNTTNDHGTPSRETMLQIQELKRLVYSNPHYCPNPDGNNSFLDEKLEELRMIDKLMVNVPSFYSYRMHTCWCDNAIIYNSSAVTLCSNNSCAKAN